MISDVLAQRVGTVSPDITQHADTVEVGHQHLAAFVKTSGIIGCPPINQIALFVVLTTLVIKTVGHFVANHHADSPVIDSIIAVSVEERRLQDTGREADFVGTGIIIGIDRLGTHEPFILVDRFAQLVQVILVFKTHDLFHIGQVALFRIDGQGRIITPLVGVTDFHLEGSQFLLCFGFRFVTHPFQGGNAFAQ